MSGAAPPPIDRRGYGEFVAQAETLLERYTGWRPPEGDPAAALVRVFARMAERVADRLNRMPDRNFLAYLDLLGVELRPPQPARVPLTFSLAAGATADAVVPARTPVAAQLLEGEEEPVVFETERELVVTRTTLAAVAVRDPHVDRWADRTAQAAAGAAFAAFEGSEPVPHRLHVSCRAALQAEAPKSATLRLRTISSAPPWLNLVDWTYHDAAGEHPLAAGAPTSGDLWTVPFPDVPALPDTVVAGRAGAWISARLRVPVRLRRQLPDALRAEGQWITPPGPFHPFGRTALVPELALAADDVFSVPGAVAEVEFELDDDFPPAVDPTLRVQWEYATGFSYPRTVTWTGLGVSSPGAELVGTTAFAFADGTRALTRSGTVRFRVPPNWLPAPYEGVSGLWLRARVTAGGYGPVQDFHPPVVRRTAVSYALDVPEVYDVGMTVRQVRTGIVPPAGFLDNAALDLTKDFLPFGATPARGTAFFIALPGLVGKTGARATLTVVMGPPTAAHPAGWQPPRLRWEFWNGTQRRWETLGESGTGAANPATHGFQDTTAAFGAATDSTQTIAFNVPAAMREVEVNGRTEGWIRARIVAGDYGVAATYVEQDAPNGAGGTMKVWRLIPPTYHAPSLRSVQLGYTWDSLPLPADAVAAENDGRVEVEISAEGLIRPFVPSAEERPSLYLGFARPGGGPGFANRTVSLYLGVAPALYGDPPAPFPPDEPAAVAWWYWNGAEWARLVVRDETAALTRRGMVTFTGPADFRPSSELGREAYWLRARLERGGWRHPPRLERVLLNTVWAEHATLVAGEVLGSSNGKPGQTFRAVRAPVLPGERLEVREAELPSAAERDELVREAGADALTVVADAAGRPLEVWVRWTAVPDFYGSGPRSRHYVVDRLAGEVTFGDGSRGMVPPQGRAGVRMGYRTGGGPRGNRPAGNLSQLRATVPYVDRVTNLEPAAGGAAAESLDSVRRRGPRTVRHRDRAVTVADLEDLAMDASPDVAVARAIPPAAEDDAGRVEVIVVPRSSAARPVPGMELLDRVGAWLRARLPATVQLEVRGPLWVRVDVDVEVVPVAPEASGEVQLALERRILDYLHPLTGGADGAGWPFGRYPRRSDLFAVAEATPGVDHVLSLVVRVDQVPLTGDFLVHAGAAQVVVAGGMDG